MAAFTNKAINPAFAGATVGTIGAGGALPTGWSFDADTAALAVVSVSTVNGRQVLRLRVTLNNTAGGAVDRFPQVHCGLASASAATVYSAGMMMSRPTPAGGAADSVTTAMEFYNASNASTGRLDFGAPVGTALKPYRGQMTAPAATTQVELTFFWVILAATNVDAYIDISESQIVAGTYFPIYIGGNTTGTYSADVTTQTITTTGGNNLPVPAGVDAVDFEGWSAGGSPAAATTCEDGGASGAWGLIPYRGLSSSDTIYWSFDVGQTQGGSQPATTWAHKNTNSGTAAELILTSANALVAGAVTAADLGFAGAAGRAKQSGTTGSRAGSGGSSSAGPWAAGAQGSVGATNVAGAAGAVRVDGGTGGAGGVSGANGAAGGQPGGGAGGGGNTGGNALAGGAGQVRYSYLTPAAAPAYPFRRDLSYYLEQ